MCLTPEAHRERKWGALPALRKALEDKEIPSNYYGMTSASDNMFDATVRLMEITVLVAKYEGDIKEIAVSVGRDKMVHDLFESEHALKDASYFFQRAIDEVQRLYRTL